MAIQGPDSPRPLPSPASFWLSVLAAVVVWVGSVLALVGTSPRLLAAWHGFLHSGIAARFPAPTLVPENPYFAGEPLAYYWFYQWVGSALSRATGVDPLHAFQIIGLSSLALLVVSGALAGRQLYRSTIAGLVIGYLALAGMNPLGPVIAAAKHVIRDQPLVEHRVADSGDEIFVTNQQSDNRLARPLLGALHIGTDWRSSHDLVWFFDVSSRGPSIALLMVMAWLVTHQTRRRWPALALIPTGALTAAFNPIVGLSVAAALSASAVTVRLVRGWVSSVPAGRASIVISSIAFTVGVLIAWPSYAHLFAFSNPMVITLDELMVLKAAALAAGFIVLLPLALWGVRQVDQAARPGIETVTLASLMLIGVVPFVGLYEGNQHNIVNAASCLLAVPAAAWTVGRRGAVNPPSSRRRATVLILIFLPTTIGIGLAFGGRGDLPLEIRDGVLRRTPRDEGLDAFYRWAATSTPRDAIFVVDPDRPVKMSGNVSEIPAFTGRTVFVDHLTYLTEPYPDRETRAEIARRLIAGEALEAEHTGYLSRFKRPLFVVTIAADPAIRARLIEVFGAPAFSRDFVAAFPLTGRASGGSGPKSP